MKYKVGDKVKVREDLKIGKSYNEKIFVDDMEKYKGQIVTMKVVGDDNYRIEEDNQDWYWTDEMLEDIEEEMNLEDFLNALWKNPEIITVYTIGDVSKELCGGPHVKNTSELGRFKIKKEESSSSGVRRIKAVLIDE